MYCDSVRFENKEPHELHIQTDWNSNNESEATHVLNATSRRTYMLFLLFFFAWNEIKEKSEKQNKKLKRTSNRFRPELVMFSMVDFRCWFFPLAPMLAPTEANNHRISDFYIYSNSETKIFIFENDVDDRSHTTTDIRHTPKNIWTLLLIARPQPTRDAFSLNSVCTLFGSGLFLFWFWSRAHKTDTNIRCVFHSTMARRRAEMGCAK